VNALSLDTATEALCLCALGGEAWASMVVRRGLQHSPALLPLAERLLRDVDRTVSDLDLVVCSVGPGSFTGIRIGISTALGIGHGRGIPVVGVSTLDALGRQSAAWPGEVLAVIDARRGNIYTASYRDGTRQGGYQDLSPSELAAVAAAADRPLLAGPDAPWIRGLLGPGAEAVPVSETVDPRTALVLGIEILQAQGAEASYPRPLYLRKSEAERVSPGPAAGSRRETAGGGR
jgi:tRNA threonylcarbamoyladenosine biosynthesis protein TsaB